MPATPERSANPAAAPAATPLPCRIALGFDFGRVRIGIAVGEAITGSARPLSILPTRRRQPDWSAIDRLIQEWRPDWLVVGVPRYADDTASAMTEATLRFGRQLHGRFHLPVATIDERLSSWEAEQQQFAAMTAKRRRRDDTAVDARAAAVILETWFNQSRSFASWAMPNS